MLTLLILKVLQSPAFPLHASTQHLNVKELFPLLLLHFFLLLTQLLAQNLLLLGTIPGKVPCFTTTKTCYFWQVPRFPCDYTASLGSLASFLGNCWGSALTPCTCNRWYDSGSSWAPIGFSSWSFPFQSELLFPVGHTLLPPLGILLDPPLYNFGRCVLLLHMNSKI